MEWTSEASRVCRFLARFPSGYSTLSKKDCQSLLLNTGGIMLAGGYLYNIITKHLSADIYRISLSLSDN